MRHIFYAVVIAALSAGCGSRPTEYLSTAPSSATATPSANVAGVIGFGGLTTDKAAVSTYSESGFTVTLPSGSWQSRATYGNPLPFIQFFAQPNVPTNGEARVAFGAPTYFKSVDLYSSTTPIPYVITGVRSGATVFALSGTVGNTYGNFRTISNPNQTLVDALTIVLTNVSTVQNPMGLDNIATSTSPVAPPAQYALAGSVVDNESGQPISGARLTISGGPETSSTTTTDATGNFRFPALTEAGFSVSAAATGFLNGSQSTYLSANQSMTFRLLRDPRVVVSAPAPAGATVIGFGSMANGAALSSYPESGFTVSTTESGWAGTTGYGHPAPFIQFYAEGGTTVTRSIAITAGGAPFTYFGSEIYSSTVKVPYTITGTRNGATVFTTSAELPNPTGNFRQVLNGSPSLPIDALSITLTNAAAACCRNPVGVDNIIVIK
jgi:hypothetical protein